MFWNSYEIWQCTQTSETKLSSVQGKILFQPPLNCFLHVPCRQMSLKFFWENLKRKAMKTAGNLLEDGEKTYSMALFPSSCIIALKVV